MFNHSVPRSFALFTNPLLLLLAIAAGSLAQAQSTVDTGTDLHFHKFQPKVSPDLAANSASAADLAVDDSGISRFAMNQIGALEREKDARTPVQQKIDSNILYTVRMMQGQPAAAGVDYLDTGIDLDDKNNIVVDISANVTDALRSALTAAGATLLNENVPLHSIRAIVPPAAMETIAASPDVLFIAPKQDSFTNRLPVPVRKAARAMSPELAVKTAKIRDMILKAQRPRPNSTGTPFYGQGSVETEGDLAHQTFQARGTYGVNGAGLKIGVLSDNVTTAASSQALGDLPPTCGNGVPSPCLTVLAGQAGSGTGDEGTAILEIVHDMVPGADLFFATADPTITQFAANIRALQAAGCNIIIDDVGYYIENPFQDGQASTVTSTSNGGVVTQAVNDVVALGAYYFSSAANSGNLDSATSGTYEGDFVPMTPPTVTSLPTTGKVHNFGTVASPLAYDAITVAATPIYLFWADPLGAAVNDYDLYLTNTAGTSVSSASANVQSPTRDAYEAIGCSTSCAIGRRIFVYQKAGAANVFFHLNIYRGQLAVATAGETHGHGAATGAYTVAATPALTPYSTTTPTGPYPNAFGSGNQIETFSSDGYRRIFFNADSTPITAGNFSSTGGKLLNKPEITGADGVSVTGVGGFSTPFYGTSAAAPAAASVAALVLSAKPNITPAQMKTALTSTAVDIMALGLDRDSGSGIVMALPAVQSTGATGAANPEFGTITATENPGDGNGAIEAGEGALLNIQLKNSTGVLAATGITAKLTTSTAGVTIKQNASSAYPDLAIGAGPQSNITPFAFTLASNFGCVQTANFTLTLSYNGGLTRVLNFNVPVGQIPITNTIGTAITPPSGITFGTGSVASTVGRLSRSGVASACSATKAYPGAITGTAHAYDSYTFKACQAGCVATQLTVGAAAANVFESVYSPSFTGTSLQTNYVGDGGQSNATETAAFTATANTNYTVVVNDVNGNPPTSGVPNTYTVLIPSCSLRCSPYPLPVALAQNVTVSAATQAGTANASIDNGSNDPSGGTITLSQSPAGPYPVGTTSVILTVTNKLGAFAQATANVTVNAPLIAPTIVWNPSSLTGFKGVAIGSGVLDATSTTPGTFSYTSTSGSSSAQTIAAGSILVPGTYTLTAAFTPSDATTYSTQTATIAYTVIGEEIFIANPAGTTSSLYEDGSVESNAIPGGGIGTAVDANGYVWAINTDGASLSKFTNVGAFATSYSGIGLTGVTALAFDGNSNLWITKANGAVSAISNAGAALSTTKGSAAVAPTGVAIDISGNVWIANAAANTVDEIVGGAAPVAPLATAVANASPGTKP